MAVRLAKAGHRQTSLWTVLAMCLANAGHTGASPWCLRRYESVLSRTPPYNASIFALGQLPRGTRVLADGNSHFAEVVVTWACESDGVDVWKVGSLESNSLLVHHRGRDVAMLLIDNERRYQAHASTEAPRLLRRLGFRPHVVLLGNSNEKDFAARATKDTVSIRIVPHVILCVVVCWWW